METNNMLMHLMQNVVDKLDIITSKLHKKKDLDFDKTLLEEIPKSQNLIVHNSETIVKNQVVLNKQLSKLKEHIVLTIKNNKPIVNDNQTHNYCVFGQDTPFTSRLLLSLIAIILISSFGFKYVPNYLNERSTIRLERDQYKLFYQYVFLNAYNNDKSKSNNVEQTFSKIKKKDSSFLYYIGGLSKRYNKTIQKENLEAQLRSLNATK